MTRLVPTALLLLGTLTGCAGYHSVPLSHGAGPEYEGRWQVHTKRGPHPAHLAAEAAARDLTALVSARLPLRDNIRVRLEGCGRAEVAWFPSVSEVVLCHEMVERVAEVLGVPLNRRAPDELLRRAFRFILAHEIGHAVQDLFGVIGDRSGEVMADEFAALFLLATPELAADVIPAATLLQRLAEPPDLIEVMRTERLSRAAMLRCLWDGSRPDAEGRCRTQYLERRAWWSAKAPALTKAVGG